MDEEQKPVAGETPAAGQGTGETPGAGQPEDEAYDKERAMETIRKLRLQVRDAEKSSKRLRELEEAETAKKQSELSEAEKAKQIAAKAQQTAQAAEAALRDATIRYEFMLAAMRPGSGVEPTAADAAWKLLDRDGVEVDEQGRPRDLGKVLKELVRMYPFLAAKTQERAPDINAGSKGSGSDKAGDAAARAEELKRRFRL